jgi:primosomal protein N'
MFVIDVIPLTRGVLVDSLSYYSPIEYQSGALVTIPLRNASVQALVLSSKPVSAAKTALKTATFSLRKLPPQEGTRSLPPSLIKTAQAASERLPAQLGAILYALLPPDIRSGERPYPALAHSMNTEDTTPRILTDTAANRFIAYRSHIRQSFAHRGSVMFIVPTSAAVEEARAKLERGIESRVIAFCGTLGKKKLNDAYAAFEDLSQAKLIIATPSYAFLDRHDITTIVVESCGSAAYTGRTRPYADCRELLKIHAKHTGRSIILGDALPKTEDETLRRSETYATFEEHTKRLELPGAIEIAMHHKSETQEKFTLCTEALENAIALTLEGKGHVFLYAARRGIAPLITCYDCGYIFRCPDSGAPYSLLRTYKDGEEQRWFYSSTSGKRVRAADVCPQCGSWRLREYGVGIQQAYDDMRARFPKAELFLFDHTTASTHAKAQKIADAFYASKRAILLGTSMALPYLGRGVDTTGVISYEAMRAIPTWRADETVLSLLLFLREHTQRDVVIQTRSEPDELLEYARRGLIDQFYDGEIALREALGYPPYSVFILLSYLGSKAHVEKVEEQLKGQLAAWSPSFYSAPHSLPEKTLRYALIRRSAQEYPDKTLLDTLRMLPPYIKIEVNPDRIV